MENLNITIIQSDLHWEDKAANLHAFSQKIESITEPTDLIILPEMFTTGFSMKSKELGETMEGKTVNWMKQMAKEKNCAITGSFICRENKYYNRLLWVTPNGVARRYDKRHLFSMGGEDKHYTAGDKRLIATLNGWRICPLICYDLRFPVFSRNTKRDPYDVLIYVANWPEARIDVWNKLLCARAIENQCYVAGVNRVGVDGNFVMHTGNSVVLDSKGNTICSIESEKEEIKTVTLVWEELETFRKKFPVLKDAD